MKIGKGSASGPRLRGFGMGRVKKATQPRPACATFAADFHDFRASQRDVKAPLSFCFIYGDFAVLIFANDVFAPEACAFLAASSTSSITRRRFSPRTFFTSESE